MQASTITERHTPFASSHSREDAANSEQVILERIDNQIGWYEKRGQQSRRLFKGFKTVTITAAAALPVLATCKMPGLLNVSAVLGVLIAIVESLQQLHQYQTNWTSYRAAAEALKREKYLYIAQAGDYSGPDRPVALLAERAERLISLEHAGWIGIRSQTGSHESGVAPR